MMILMDGPDRDGINWHVSADTRTDEITITTGDKRSVIKSSRPFSSMPFGLDVEVVQQINKEMEEMLK